MSWRHSSAEQAAIVAAIEAGDAEAAERAAALCLDRAVAALESNRPGPHRGTERGSLT
ncbi:hypothetical protein ACIRVK_42600 [Streptomyces sp. NPDC101152]|uniref:hypothetical protein n=1 Tax=Streptomyces sp. NPDC101152 TaxID=3366116 RepID=UPI00380E1D91